MTGKKIPAGPPSPLKRQDEWTEEEVAYEASRQAGARRAEESAAVPSPAPAAPEVDLEEVPALLDAYAKVLDDAWSDEAPANAAREAVEAAVRSLVERARLMGWEAGRDAAATEIRPGPYPTCCEGDECDVKQGWHARRNLSVRIEELRAPIARALTPAGPGAADESKEGGT